MAALRGSKDSLLYGIIEALKLCKTLPNSEIRNGIDGVINSCINERDKHKSKKNKKEYEKTSNNTKN